MEMADESLQLVELEVQEARANMDKFVQELEELLDMINGERPPKNEYEQAIFEHQGQPIMQQIKKYRMQLRKAMSARSDTYNKIQGMKKSKIY